MVDYTSEYNRRTGTDYIKVHGRDRIIFFLSALDTPRKRFDGKMAYYALDVSFLSQDCCHATDEAWACREGQDYILLSKTEGKVAIKTENLFESFSAIG